MSDTNPFTGNEVKGLAQLRKTIPVLNPAVKANLFGLLNTHDLVLISAFTGGGKSVGVPSMVLEYLKYERPVVCTQPRTFNASTIASSVAELLYGEQVGLHVGYRYRHHNKTSSSTLLLYTTDGSMVGKAFKDPSMAEYGAVIIDEAHERNANIDVLLYLVKERLAKPNPPKFVIMSATMQAAQFTDYFKGTPIGQLDVEGRTFPITRHYLDRPIDAKSYLDKILETIKTIIGKLPPDPTAEDILVFLPSTKDIETLCTTINTKLAGTLRTGCVCLPLYSGLNDDSKDLAKDDSRFRRMSGNPKVKIVLSTNLAETGVTVKGIKYVIDSGYEYDSGFDPVTRSRTLELSRIAKSNVLQRMGRAGRVAPGICYHMYTEREFDGFAPYALPDICTGRIDEVVLKLLHHGGSLDTLDRLIQPPSKDRVVATVKYLTAAGAITSGALTDLGHCIHKLNTEVAIAKFLIAARAYGIDSVESLVYAGILTVGADFATFTRKPSKQSPEYRVLLGRMDAVTARFSDRTGEIFAIRRLLREYDGGNGLRNTRRVLNTRNLDEVIKYTRASAGIYADVSGACTDGVPRVAAPTDESKVLAALRFGYSDQLASKSNGTKYSSDTYPMIASVETDGVKTIGDKILYIEAAKILGNNKFNGIVNLG